MGYIAVDQLAYSITGGLQDSPLSEDMRAEAQTAVDSASTQIDDYCGRRFLPPETGVRRFTADDPFVLRLPRFNDITAITAISIDSNGDGVIDTPWDISDVMLEPFDAPTRDQPYTVVSIANQNGCRAFPPARGGVQIEGMWGWGDLTPSPVLSATLLRASALWGRRKSSDGVIATTGDQVYRISRFTDPDICALLDIVARKSRGIASMRIGTR